MSFKHFISCVFIIHLFDVCMYIYTAVSMNIGQRLKLDYFFYCSSSCFWNRSPLKLELTNLAKPSGQKAPEILVTSHLWYWNCRHELPLPDFYMDAQKPPSVPHVCIASTVQIGPFLDFKIRLYKGFSVGLGLNIYTSHCLYIYNLAYTCTNLNIKCIFTKIVIYLSTSSFGTICL